MEITKFIEFAKIVGKLKLLKRTGWVNKNIPNPESVAEHSFRTTMLAMVLAKHLKLDEEKVVKMALVHDLGEAKIGDIVTMIGSTILDNRKEKLRLEEEAFKEIVELIDGSEYLKLFHEYEQNKTPEAKLVKQIDKIEMAIQALEYEKTHNKDLLTFYESTRHSIDDDFIKEILSEIEKERI